LAATVRVTRDLDVAEECVQHAYTQALATWSSRGIPSRPGAWLTTVARRRAADLARRDATLRRKLPLLVSDESEPPPDETDASVAGDDRLRLIFVCCHPALTIEARVALTLRLLCGLTTGEVARAFLVSEATMAARITRAKKKIATAHIPYRVPPIDELPARTDGVLLVVHLLYTTGHTAPDGADLIRRDLVERAIDLARMLRRLLPSDPDVAALLALILLTDARRHARETSDGRIVLLADQDRSRWDHAAIDEGIALVHESLRRRPPGRFLLMAAIAAVHTEATTWEGTDWAEIVGLYDHLVQVWPSPVVALNRAVAIGYAEGPASGLSALDRLADEPQLAAYRYLASARADFLRRLGRLDEALDAYREALMLTENTVEREFLDGRIREILDGSPP
jgi:RNA polymerase sigma factor (sigma-70 family)